MTMQLTMICISAVVTTSAALTQEKVRAWKTTRLVDEHSAADRSENSPGFSGSYRLDAFLMKPALSNETFVLDHFGHAAKQKQESAAIRLHVPPRGIASNVQQSPDPTPVTDDRWEQKDVNNIVKTVTHKVIVKDSRAVTETNFTDSRFAGPHPLGYYLSRSPHADNLTVNATSNESMNATANGTANGTTNSTGALKPGAPESVSSAANSTPMENETTNISANASATSPTSSDGTKNVTGQSQQGGSASASSPQPLSGNSSAAPGPSPFTYHYNSGHSSHYGQDNATSEQTNQSRSSWWNWTWSLPKMPSGSNWTMPHFNFSWNHGWNISSGNWFNFSGSSGASSTSQSSGASSAPGPEAGSSGASPGPEAGSSGASSSGASSSSQSSNASSAPGPEVESSAGGASPLRPTVTPKPLEPFAVYDDSGGTSSTDLLNPAAGNS